MHFLISSTTLLWMEGSQRMKSGAMHVWPQFTNFPQVMRLYWGGNHWKAASPLLCVWYLCKAFRLTGMPYWCHSSCRCNTGSSPPAPGSLGWGGEPRLPSLFYPRCCCLCRRRGQTSASAAPGSLTLRPSPLGTDPRERIRSHWIKVHEDKGEIIHTEKNRGLTLSRYWGRSSSMTLEELELTSDGFIIAALPERENIDTMISLKVRHRGNKLPSGNFGIWAFADHSYAHNPTYSNTPDDR